MWRRSAETVASQHFIHILPRPTSYNPSRCMSDGYTGVADRMAPPEIDKRKSSDTLESLASTLVPRTSSRTPIVGLSTLAPSQMHSHQMLKISRAAPITALLRMIPNAMVQRNRASPQNDFEVVQGVSLLISVSTDLRVLERWRNSIIVHYLGDSAIWESNHPLSIAL